MLRWLKNLFTQDLSPFPDEVRGGSARRVPKVSRDEVEGWIQDAKEVGSKHILVVHQHNLYDNGFEEVFPFYLDNEQELSRRVHLVDGSMDGTCVQIIDLDRNIDDQLRDAVFIELTLEEQLKKAREELATSQWEAACAPMHAAEYAARNCNRLRAEIARLQKLIDQQESVTP